jgi:hypothetical protein
MNALDDGGWVVHEVGADLREDFFCDVFPSCCERNILERVDAFFNANLRVCVIGSTIDGGIKLKGFFKLFG